MAGCSDRSRPKRLPMVRREPRAIDSPQIVRRHDEAQHRLTTHLARSDSKPEGGDQHAGRHPGSILAAREGAQQRQTLDAVRRRQRHLLRDEASHRVPDDVKTIDAARSMIPIASSAITSIESGTSPSGLEPMPRLSKAIIRKRPAIASTCGLQPAPRSRRLPESAEPPSRCRRRSRTAARSATGPHSFLELAFCSRLLLSPLRRWLPQPEASEERL